MTQGERVRMIRKHPNVNLTLEKFGEKLGIKKSALSLIENGKNNLTEQMAKSICREFRVNYFWLSLISLILLWMILPMITILII